MTEEPSRRAVMPKQATGKATRKSKPRGEGKKKRGERPLSSPPTDVPSALCPAGASERNGPNAHPDPNAPKRGLSAYMFFANEQRENVRDENPGIGFGMASRLPSPRTKKKKRTSAASMCSRPDAYLG